MAGKLTVGVLNTGLHNLFQRAMAGEVDHKDAIIAIRSAEGIVKATREAHRIRETEVRAGRSLDRLGAFGTTEFA